MRIGGGIVSIASALLVALPATAHALALGLDDPGFGPDGTQAQTHAAYEAMTAIDGTVVRFGVSWAKVAPVVRPPGFDATNPGDPHYDWAPVDAVVRNAAQRHLRVLIGFYDAPTWAEGPRRPGPYVLAGAWNPDPREFAQFVHAAAVRYSGTYPDPLDPGATLPRVNYWESWNEPNLPEYFSAPNPISAYRVLLNQAFRALKSVRRDNVVVLGGLAPVSSVPGSSPPIDFAAKLLCLHQVGSGFRANRACPVRTDFDVLGIHPYNLAATPTKHAYTLGDTLVADVGNVGQLVRTADRLHTAGPRIHHQLWVTEWSWTTNPPNPLLGDPPATAARYVAYSLYEMWAGGTALIVWQQVLDSPAASMPGAGLFTYAGQPKLTLRALAFPFIAAVSHGRGFAWGRVPTSHPVRVQVDHLVDRRWVSVALVKSGSDGVFTARFPATANGRYRAQVSGGPTSLAYDSTPIPPRRIHLT